jgi:RNA polymerase sigma factor (sigma-70 family)
MRSLSPVQEPGTTSESAVGSVQDTRPIDGGALLAAAAGGDHRAWAELVARYGGLLRHVCWRYGVTGSQAEDVAQVTWLTLFTHIETIHSPRCIASWLATTAARECLSLRRRAAREIPTTDVDQAITDDLDIDDRIDAIRLRAAIRQAVAMLSTRERKLVELLLQPEQPPYAEISRRLGMPIGAIGPVRQRALRHLRMLLTQSTGDAFLGASA